MGGSERGDGGSRVSAGSGTLEPLLPTVGDMAAISLRLRYAMRHATAPHHLTAS